MFLEKSIELSVYLVQNTEKKFFRAKGYAGSGLSWVDEPEKARIYAKIGQARSIVSYYAKHYPDFGIPVIIKLSFGKSEIIDEKERLLKVLEKDLKKATKEVENSQSEVPRYYRRYSLAGWQKQKDNSEKAISNLKSKMNEE